MDAAATEAGDGLPANVHVFAELADAPAGLACALASASFSMEWLVEIIEQDPAVRAAWIAVASFVGRVEVERARGRRLAN